MNQEGFLLALIDKLEDNEYDTLLVGPDHYRLLLQDEKFLPRTGNAFVGWIFGLRILYCHTEKPVLLRVENAFPVAKHYQKD